MSEYIEYINRSRAYYAAQGYSAYAWANFEDAPFAPMRKPLAQSKLALITTAAPFREDLDDQGPGAKYNAEAKFFEVFTSPINPTPDLRISHIGYDRLHCLAQDPKTWLPVEALVEAEKAGLVGEFAKQIIGVPTNRSQSTTIKQDAPQAFEHCQQLAVDAVLLVPT
ncbi:MAG: hypothetical protein GXP16_18025 [Gammaproteobacteria bacterium]|nr:hypothetical protein [Gammaproteobacteria bacterium]